MAISQSTLRANASRYTTVRTSTESYSFSSSSRKTAFLCHSHKDQDLVKGLIVTFKEAGVDLYIDWLDQTMPEQPNQETAKKIKDKITKADIFIFLATENSKNSRWCPWEIGYADTNDKGIYIIPTSYGHNTYGNEYLELYPKIDKGIYERDGRPGYFLFQQGKDSGMAISNYNLR